MAKVLLVAASPAPQARSQQLLDLAAAQLRAHTVDHLHLRTLPAEPLLLGDRRHPALAATAAAVHHADAVVIGGPVYKTSLSGLLKCWLDILPRHGMAGKQVLPITTAQNAADLALYADGLRVILSSMDASTVHPMLGVLDANPPLFDTATPRHDTTAAVARAVRAFAAALVGEAGHLSLVS